MTESPDEGRTWSMFANDFGEHEHRVRFHDIFDEEWMSRLSDSRPETVPVLVTEDPDGDYYAWQDTGAEGICLIFDRHLFEVAFTYGSQAEIDRGRGRKLRVSVHRVDETH